MSSEEHRDFSGMGLRPDQIGTDSAAVHDTGSRQIPEEVFREWVADLGTGKFRDMPDKYQDRQSTIAVLRDGTPFGYLKVVRGNQGEVVKLEAVTLEDRDDKGRAISTKRFGGDGKLHGSTERTYDPHGSNPESIVERDPQGKMVYRESHDGKNTTVQYYDQQEQLAGRHQSHIADYGGQRTEKYYGPDGAELNLDEDGKREWGRQMQQHQSRAY